MPQSEKNEKATHSVHEFSLSLSLSLSSSVQIANFSHFSHKRESSVKIPNFSSPQKPGTIQLCPNTKLLSLLASAKAGHGRAMSKWDFSSLGAKNIYRFGEKQRFCSVPQTADGLYSVKIICQAHLCVNLRRVL
jgi:hypothetical protein